MADEQVTEGEATASEPSSDIGGVDLDGIEGLPQSVNVNDDQAESDDGSDQGAPDLVELDLLDEKVQVPKRVADNYKKIQGELTRAQQQAAEQRKQSPETDRQDPFEADETVLQNRAIVTDAERRIAEYDRVDWNQLHQNDPAGYQRHRDFYRDLKDAKREAQDALNEAKSQRTAKAEEDFNGRLQQAEAFATKNIPGWNADLSKKIMDNAMEAGLSVNDIRSNLSPATLQLLHQAYIGRQILARKAAPKTPEATPTQTVRNRSQPSRGPSDKQPIDVWMKERDKQLGKANGASA